MGAELNAKTQGRKDARDTGGLATLRPGDLALSEGFRDTPLGPLPEAWEVVQFEDAIRCQPARVGKVKQQDYMPTGRFPIIDQSQSLVAGYWDDPLDAYQGELPVVVFGDHTRVFKFVDFPFVCGADGTKVLLPSTKFDPSYFFFALSSIDIPSRGYNRHYPLLKQKLLPCPPQHEQRAIAYVLQTVQEAREATERVIAAARELKRSLMHHLFTYGPVPVAQADQVELRGTEIGAIPTHWDTSLLGKVSQISTGTTPSTKEAKYYEGSIAFIRTSEIANGPISSGQTFVTDEAVSDYNLKIFPPGTVFMAMYGQGKTRGQVGLLKIEATTSQNTAAIVPDRGRLQSEYLWSYLLSQYERLRGEGIQGHISHLNLSYVKQLSIPLPPLTEQQEIVRMLSFADDKIAAEEARRGALEALFHTLLHHLMTGRIRTQGRKDARTQSNT